MDDTRDYIIDEPTGLVPQDVRRLLAQAATGETVILPPCIWGHWADPDDAAARRMVS